MEISLFTSNSMRGVLDTLLPEFERTTGNTVRVSFDPAQIMLKRIAAGETADVAILGRALLDELAQQGKIVPGSQRTLARCRVGVGVLAGHSKPDVSSLAAFKRALLEAKSVAFTVSGASGIHFSKVIETLGIADAVHAKEVRQPGGLVGELLVAGKAELAIQQIPELLAVPGVELVGPLPQEVQATSTSGVGIFASSERKQAAQALADLLTSPAAAKVLQEKGHEPVRCVLFALRKPAEGVSKGERRWLFVLRDGVRSPPQHDFFLRTAVRLREPRTIKREFQSALDYFVRGDSVSRARRSPGRVRF
jgi:molybdate transport system substrate-binding protein